MNAVGTVVGIYAGIAVVDIVTVGTVVTAGFAIGTYRGLIYRWYCLAYRRRYFVVVRVFIFGIAVGIFAVLPLVAPSII